MFKQCADKKQGGGGGDERTGREMMMERTVS